jgi:hypothetical protein
MMRIIEESHLRYPTRLVTGLVLLLVSSVASAQVEAPPAPTMTLNDGKLLVNLARGGMAEYIKSRSGSDKQLIPPSMKHLTTKFHPASVTLRSSGKFLARSFRADTNVCRSVLSAALDVMRSPNLPDRITPSLLAQMTVEIEIHGPSRAVSDREISSCVIQGMTGVKVSRGLDKGYVLPSTICAMGLSPKQTYHLCLAQLPKATLIASKTVAWSIFNTRHYVGYPDATVVQLFRGKILVGAHGLTDEALSETASTAGLFLINGQDTSGAYGTPGRKATLHEHLYATYAMAKLSRHDKRKLFSDSVNSALEYASEFLVSDKNQSRILTKSSRGPVTESPTRATAWLLLAISELPPDDDSKKLSEKLMRALKQDVVAVVGPSHGVATPSQLMDWSTALMALRKTLPKTPESVKLLEPLTKIMQAWSRSRQKLSPMVLRGTGGITVLPRWRQIGDSDLPDRRGGFISSGVEPKTFDTAIAAVCLAEAVESVSIDQTKRTAISKQIRRSRQFCRQMLYRSREAYWSNKPVKMIGGLRVSPASAAVSIDACAAAIEAFLLD